MKPVAIFFMLFLVFSFSKAQNISQIIDEVKLDSLVKTVREFSGEDSVIVSGTKTVIKNRAAYLGFNLAENYLIEQLTKYQLQVQTQKYSINGLNILGIQQGTKNQESAYIICAHHDAVANFCADDNASGVAAVLETARVLSSKCIENTIIYAFWDEEEAGLWGSDYYARTAASAGQKIAGIINMDMLGYDSNNDRKFDIHVNGDPSSTCFADSIINIIARCKLELEPHIINPGSDRSDHYSFWRRGYYNAILYGERIFNDDANPAYHSNDDRIGLFNLPYFYELAKLTSGLTASLSGLCSTNAVTTEMPVLKVKLFPNPVAGLLEIELQNSIETLVRITDLQGRVLFKNQFLSQKFSIDFSTFSKGIYLVRLQNRDGIYTSKVACLK